MAVPYRRFTAAGVPLSRQVHLRWQHAAPASAAHAPHRL